MVHKYRSFFTVHHDENRNEPSSLGWEKNKYTFPSGLNRSHVSLHILQQMQKVDCGLRFRKCKNPQFRFDDKYLNILVIQE